MTRNYAGFVSPFKPAFFAGNRAKLIEVLPANALVILTAHRTLQQAADSGFPFWQEPSFQYFSGICEPDWRLVIDCAKRQSWLVAPSINAVLKTFDGALEADEAKQTSGVERVLTQRQFQRWLKTVAGTGRPVYTLLPQTALARYMRLSLNPALRLLVRQLRGYGMTPLDCRQQIARLRAIKQKPEVAALEHAITITNDALRVVYENRANYKFEYECEATFLHEFRRRGAEGATWTPIIAAGKDACTLHHVKNMSPIHKKDWLLIDVGTRVCGYTADISRTFPVTTTTAWQREIFNGVQFVHDEAIKLIHPGIKPTELVQQVDVLMMDTLKQLGLIKRRSQKELRKRFPHAVGHGLGLDAHESLGRFETFQEGMVLTVEPGIYVEEKGFGVRTENDILITKNGARNLSGGLPDNLWQL
ncbi:MAG TPA: aminopeptidase P N-terminal domain-containing protein [Candidatus Saccharimonadales bacterium]